nr:hypothetical protein CFP56_70446 [Quercus suber]
MEKCTCDQLITVCNPAGYVFFQFATCGGFKAYAIKGLHFPLVHLSAKCWFATCGGFKACATKGLHFPLVNFSTCLVSIDVIFVQDMGNFLKIKCNSVKNKSYTDDMELGDAAHTAILILKEGQTVILLLNPWSLGSIFNWRDKFYKHLLKCNYPGSFFCALLWSLVLETVFTVLVIVVEDIECSDIADVIVELNLRSASNAL